jgi:hypothetical protein
MRTLVLDFRSVYGIFHPGDFYRASLVGDRNADSRVRGATKILRALRKKGEIPSSYYDIKNAFWASLFNRQKVISAVQIFLLYSQSATFYDEETSSYVSIFNLNVKFVQVSIR